MRVNVEPPGLGPREARRKFAAARFRDPAAFAARYSTTL
jgi:hypothetical protein